MLVSFGTFASCFAEYINKELMSYEIKDGKEDDWVTVRLLLPSVYEGKDVYPVVTIRSDSMQFDLKLNNRKYNPLCSAEHLKKIPTSDGYSHRIKWCQFSYSDIKVESIKVIKSLEYRVGYWLANDNEFNECVMFQNKEWYTL